MYWCGGKRVKIEKTFTLLPPRLFTLKLWTRGESTIPIQSELVIHSLIRHICGPCRD